MEKIKTKPAQAKQEPVKKKKYWIDLLYLFILMIIVISVYNKVYDKKLWLGGDNVAYFITGKAIADGQGYTNVNTPNNSPAIWYPPGYPFISAIVMKIFGEKIEVMNVANGFFLYGSLIFLYLITIRFTKNKHLSYVITIISALNMHVLSYAIIAMTEIPFLFTSFGSIYFLMRMKKLPLPFKDYNFWIFFTFLMFSYYIRPTGLVLIGGVVLYFLFEKNWKMAGIIVAMSLICAFPWYLRNKSIGGYRYSSQVVLKNPYRPEQGGMKTKDWFDRIQKNAKRYVTLEIPSAMLGYKIENMETYSKPKPEDKKWLTGFIFIIKKWLTGFIFIIKKWLTGFIFIILGIIGFFCLKEYRWLVVFYIAGNVAILLIWPEVWVGIRLMLTIVPLVYMLAVLSIYEGISWVSKKININEKIRKGFIPFIFLLFIFVLKGGIDYLVTNAKGQMPPAYDRYFELARWTKTNLPHNSVIVCRKPELFYLYSGCKTTNYMSTLNADSLIANMKASKATHVVLEQLGYASTGRYLYPAIQKNPEKFKLIQRLQDPDTYLFEINYDAGYKGEIKNGKRNGKGVSHNADGTVYDGEWKNDVREGEGTYTWPNGMKFVGSFRNNYRNGPGIMYLQNGQVLKSTWVNDTMNGYGRLYDVNGKLIKEGLMSKDNFINAK